MTEEEVKNIEDNCRIKSREQFIEECRKAGIKNEWYIFGCDRSKPVSIDDENIYYGTFGHIRYAVPVCRWDDAFEQLTKYKERIDWENSGKLFKIINISIKVKEYIDYYHGGVVNGIATIKEMSRKENDLELLDEGFYYSSYDRYMDEYYYHKKVSLKNLNIYLLFEFLKKTEERDKKAFGFTEKSLRASYRYPVPGKYEKEIFECIGKNIPLPEDLKNRFAEEVEDVLVDHEYIALVKFKEDLTEALMSSINKNLSKKEQIEAFSDAQRLIFNLNPAADDVAESRTHKVESEIYALACEKAGIISNDKGTNRWKHWDNI